MGSRQVCGGGSLRLCRLHHRSHRVVVMYSPSILLPTMYVSSDVPQCVVVLLLRDVNCSIVKTIHDADSFVGLSVMDFIPTSLYDGGHSSDGQAQPVWWPAFIDPLISAAYVWHSRAGLLHILFQFNAFVFVFVRGQSVKNESKSRWLPVGMPKASTSSY